MKKSKIVILILVLVAMLTSASLYFAKVVRAIAVEGEDTYPTETYCINMIINELDRKTQTNLAGNKIKIAESSQGLLIDILNVTTNEPIVKNEDGSITVPEEGIKLEIDTINAGTTYDIEIESVDTEDYYTPTFKQVTIAIEAQEDGQISAYVKQIKKDVDGREEIINKSEQNTAIFMYEDENHKIKIKNNEDLELYYVISSINGLNEEELEKADWKKYNNENGIEVLKNGVIYAKSQYKDGSFSEINQINITNIDKLEPDINVEGINLTEDKESAIVTLQLQDKEATDEYGKSRVYGYAITENEEQPENFIECTEDSEPVTIQSEEFTSNGTYYAWVKDNAENVSHVSFQVSGIIHQDDVIVAIILDCPVENLEGREFTSLKQLLDELEKNKIKASSGKVVIQIVNDINNESSVIKDKDIEIDLNGYTIESKLQEPTIKVESGKLKVVDEKYDINDYIKDDNKATELCGKYHAKVTEDGQKVNGEIINENYIGIEISQEASLELGTDNTTLGSIERPSTETPKIYGGEKGVLNKNGSFKFYDGQIYGEVPIEGEITDTPVLYEATAEQLEGIKKSILQRVSEVEALIGKTRYTKLEYAIEAAKDTDKVTEIDIVTGIARTESIEVDSTKNIIIDLNGYGITNMGTDDSYAFINYGKMEIKDSTEKSSEEGTQTNGIIKSSTNKVIDNKAGAEFKFTGGTIECTISENSLKAYLINNESNGTVTLNGGNIIISNNSSSSQAYAIYNTGTVTVNNGVISATKGTSYGIYNDDAGTITVNNVIIKGVTYGIYNNGTGTITVNDGEISGKYVIYNKNNGNVLIKGGTISTNAKEYGGGSQTIVNAGAGTITIENGTLSGTYEVINNSGTGNVVVKEGTLTSTGGNYYVIENNSNGTVTIEGGTLNGGDGIYNKKAGTVTVKNVVQINLSGSSCIGVYNEGTGKVTIESATINITPTGNNKTYGIYNNNVSGTVTLGVDGAYDPSKTMPSISGGTYGIFNNGIFNFYDGKIQGSTYAITGSVQTVQEGYDIILSKENGEEAILGHQDKIAYVGIENEKLYDDLQEAIKECEVDQTITLLKDVTIIDSQKMIIEENKNIKLNLNGHEIRTYVKEDTILNNGTLTITDNNEEVAGKILGYSKNIIKNTNKFILEKGQLTTEVISGDVTILCNESGIATIKNGSLNATGTNVYGINNKGTGTVTMEAGSLNVKSGTKAYGINNEGEGTVTLSGGTINSTKISYGTTYGINNEGTGTVKVEGGTINGYYGIYNNSTGKVKVEGGTINETSNSYGIYNNEAGTVTVTNGTINGSVYGIYNKVAGTVIVNGGTINGSSSRSDGIWNNGTGTVTVTNGIINASYNGICNNSTGTVTIENGTINGSSRGIYNSNKGTIIVKGGTISATDSTSYGIYNNSTGKVTVEEGTITATGRTSYGIFNNNTNGTIIVGIDESGIPSTTNPNISGQTNGIYNNGIFNFYDGVIKGPAKNSIQGVVSTWAKGYNVIKYVSGEYDKQEIEEGKEISILVKQNVAHLESNNQDYFSLKEAIEAAKKDSKDTIKLLQDISISTDMDSIEFNKDIVLDLDGQSIYSNKESAIINTNKLEIIDSKETGKLEGNANIIISNNKDATLVIKKVLLNQKQAESNCISNNGTLTIEGATLNVISSNSTVISNQSTGTVTIKDGTISATGSDSYGITNGGILTVTGGTISASSYGISNEGTLTVNEGTIKGKYGISNYNTGEVTIEGGTISKATYGIYNNDTGEITVKGGTINESQHGIYNVGTGKVVLEDGNIIIDSYLLSSGINNQGTGTVNVTGGTINVKGHGNNYPGYAIYNKTTGTINVTGATINATESYSYGIYNNNSGTITVGQKEEETPNMTTPDISAGRYGVYNNGIFNFYDGKIKGKTYAIVGVVDEIEDGYDIILSNKEEGEEAILGHQEQIAYVGDDKNTYYNDLQEAINACKGQQTITLLKDITIVTKQGKNIVQNKNITINLNGKEIRTYVKDNTFINNGNLTITDNSEETGKIIGYSNNIIKNTKEFILQKGEIISKSLKDESYVIYNEQGTSTIEGGNIKTLSGKNMYGIFNAGDGTVKLSGGEINISAIDSYCIYNKLNGTVTVENDVTINAIKINSGTSYGIYNEQNGTITVNGGTINGYYGIYNKDTGTVTIQSGTISSDRYGIYNNGTGTVTIQNGTISSYYGLHNQSTGNVIVNDGNINGTYMAIDNHYGTVTINNGIISGTGNNGSRAIYNISGKIIVDGGTITCISNVIDNNGGTVTINNGTISATGAGSSAIYNYNGGNITVIGGTISATGDNSYGINNSINRGTVTLGENGEDNPNTTTPDISGGTYGINNTGDFYFYDGIIKGGTIAINGKVTKTPENYKVKYQDSLKTAILDVLADFQNSILLDGIYYDSLQTAIDVISKTTSKTGTIRICDNIEKLNTPLTIPSDVNVTIALEGHTIDFENVEVGITNNGILTIIDYENVDEGDEQTQSIIRNETGTAILNNGTLTIGKTENKNTQSPVIEGKKAVDGKVPTINSGKTNNIGETISLDKNVSKIIERLKYGTQVKGTKNVLMSSNSGLSEETKKKPALSSLPEITQYPYNWTNDRVYVSMNADVIPVLNLYYQIEEIQQQDITYKIEYYLENSETADYTDIKTQSVQLPTTEIAIDTSSIESKIQEYNGYKLSKITINDSGDYTSIDQLQDKKVSNNQVVKVYLVVNEESKHDIQYTVEYYTSSNDNVAETETVTESVQLLQTELTVQKEKIKSKSFTGYKFLNAKIDNQTFDSIDSLPEKVKDKTVIKVYYVALDATITIRYVDRDKNQIQPDVIVNGKVYETYDLSVHEKQIEGYTLLEKPSFTEVMFTEEPQVFEYVYAKNAKVIENHIDRNTNQFLNRKEILGFVGDEYTGTAGNFKGYILVQRPDPETVVMKEETIELNYYYVHVSAGVIEKHIDIVSDELLDSVLYEGHEGDPYKTSAKEFNDYDIVTNEKYYTKYVEDHPEYLEENKVQTVEELLQKQQKKADDPYIPDNAEGIMTKDIIEVDYYYIKKTSVKAEYIDKITGENIPEEDGTDSTEYIYGHEEDPYETKEKEFKDYVIVQEMYPQNTKGNMTKEEIEVKYYYVHLSAGVIEKHIDIVSDELLDSVLYEGHEGDPYKTSAKEFKDYDIVTNEKYYTKYVEDHPEYLEENKVQTVEELLQKQQKKADDPYIPDNAEGIMTKDIIEVDYYYIKKTSVKAEYIDKITGENIPEEDGTDSTEYIYGHEEDPYETKEKEFKDYVIVQEMYPQNTKGNMTKEEIEVKYYYVHVSAGVIEKHIDIVSDDLLDSKLYEGHEGDPYKTSAKEFKDYDIVTSEKYYTKYVEDHPEYLEENKVQTVEELLQKQQKKADDPYIPDNAEGTMTKDIIEVKYYYIRKVKLIIHHLENETEKQLEKDEIKVVHEGENYETDSKNITGYSVVKDKMPANKEGVVGKEDIDVTYYYEKDKVEKPTPDTPKEPDRPDPTPTPILTPSQTPQPEPPKVVLPTVPQTQDPSNTATKQNTSNVSLPNTGDITPIIAIWIIILVVLVNFIQIIITKKGKNNKSIE